MNKLYLKCLSLNKNPLYQHFYLFLKIKDRTLYYGISYTLISLKYYLKYKKNIELNQYISYTLNKDELREKVKR